VICQIRIKAFARAVQISTFRTIFADRAKEGVSRRLEPLRETRRVIGQKLEEARDRQTTPLSRTGDAGGYSGDATAKVDATMRAAIERG
jgi:hypothetical protein